MANPCSERRPLVSVVTPFYNTEPFIAQCIESVLVHQYTNFEYILVDNQSTDGSGEIAEMYAKQDRRIRLLRTPQFLTLLNNQSFALQHIDAESAYCKIILADDWLYPQC